MKKPFAFLATLMLANLPATIAVTCVMTLCGVGVISTSPGLTTPTVLPAPSAAFTQSNSSGIVNAGLRVNGGTSPAAMELPGATTPNCTSPTCSFALYHEYTLNPGQSGVQNLFGTTGNVFNQGVAVGDSAFGAPSVGVQVISVGSGSKTFPWWLGTMGTTVISSVNPLSYTRTAGYNPGFYNWTASGGCPSPGAREPTGTALTGTSGIVYSVDPGFLCGGPTTVTFDGIPNVGAAQTGLSLTCLSNAPNSSRFAVTVTTSNTHGLQAGGSFTLSAASNSGFVQTYTVLPGSSGTTLIGTGSTVAGGGTCPASTATGVTLAGGGGSSFTIAAPSATTPFNSQYGTGIQFRPGQRICAAAGEFGSDSNFPGAQFYYATTENGSALPGSPSLSRWLNQGATNFTGWISSAAQSPSSPALTVTAMNSYNITSASYSTSTGFVTFTIAQNPGLIVGSEFTVSSMSAGGFNKSYVAVAGTSGTTVKGNPLDGPVGVPLANNLTSTPFATGGSLVGVIMPGMVIAGSTNYSVISPFGAFGSTGVGGPGTYGLTATQATFSVTASFATNVMTVTGTPTSQVVVGTLIAGASVPANTFVSSLGTGTGGAGTYNLSTTPGTIGTQTNTAGPIGDSSHTFSMYAAASYYYNVAPSTAAGGGTITTHAQSVFGDFISQIGSASIASTISNGGWGGNVANVGMFEGAPFPNTNGALSSTGLSQLCAKTVDYQTWAANYGGAWRSHYPLSDPGFWADDSIADLTASLTSGSLTITASNPASYAAGTANLPSGTVISGPGVSGCPSACPTVSSGTGAGPYTLSGGGTVSSEAMMAGTYKPALPLGTTQFTAGLSGSTLTVSAMTNIISGANVTTTSGAGTTSMVLAVSGGSGTGAQGQCFHDGGSQISESYPLCITGGTSPNWTVNGTLYPNGITIAGNTLTSTNSAIVPGTWIQGSGITTPVVVTGYGTGIGQAGTYTVNNPGSLTISSGSAMTGSGVSAGGAIAPGAALTVANPGIGAVFSSTMAFSGTYDSTLLGGIPTAIQSLVTTDPYFKTVPSGCTPCGWTSLTGGSIAAGAWSGNVVSIPAGGPYWIFFRAANGTSYATLPNAVFVGTTMAFTGQGNSSAQTTVGSGSVAANQSTFQGLAQIVGFNTGGVGNNNIPSGGIWAPGPPISGNFSPSTPAQTLCDRFGLNGSATSCLGDGLAGIANGVSFLAEQPVGFANWSKNGTASEVFYYDGAPQTQTIGIGDGTNTVFSSGAGYGRVSSSATTTTITSGAISTAGVMTVASANMNQAFETSVNTWAYLSPGQQVSCTACMGGSNYSGVITGFGTGTGAGGTYNVSPLPTSAISAATLTVVHNNLEFTGALGYGAVVNATISGTTLSFSGTAPVLSGAVAPGQILSDGGVHITGSPTLLGCLTNCGVVPIPGATAQTWKISSSQTVAVAEPITLTPPAGTLWPTNGVEPLLIPISTASGVVGANPIVKVGTFRLLKNGVSFCDDSATAFAYNIQFGTCLDSGAINRGWVNYVTGAYSFTFPTVPTTSDVMIASWTNRMTFNSTNMNEQIGTVGNGASTDGSFSSIAAKTGGIGAVLNGEQLGSGWPDNMLTQAALQNYLYGTQIAALHNGAPNTLQFTTGQWRGEGPIAFYGLFSYGTDLDTDQLMLDSATASSWSGTISASSGTTPSTATLTLSGAATGPMWEGEAVGCVTAGCGVPFGAEIVSLASGTWGANGSTYNLTVANTSGIAAGAFSNIASAVAMQNAMLYPGSVAYVGPFNDLTMQSGANGIGNYSVETGGGTVGALRYGHRVGLQAGAALAGNTALAKGPTVDRTSFTGCDGSAAGVSPCFDIGATYQASHSATLVSSSATITVTGGLSAGQRPFVPGMVLSCASCTAGRIILSVDLPPTQSTAAGAGQVGQTFHIVANGTMGVSTTETVNAGCSGTAGTGSNCIDFAIDINTTGTYGTAAALSTCGANNLVGTNTNLPTATAYLYPNGGCVPTGVGSFVRGFRIGTGQIMDVPLSGGSSTYDYGVDPNPTTGRVFQNAAFTCNIVGALTSPARGVVQCVYGPNYASPAAPVLGQWASGSTYASYGDAYGNTGYLGSLMGYPGGQSFLYTAGSGYSGGHYGLGGNCGTLVSGGANVPRLPVMGIDIVGGAIVNAYPDYMGNSVTATCTFPLSFTGTATITGSSGSNANLVVSASSGGLVAPAEVITLGAQVLTVKAPAGAGAYPFTATGTYPVTCATPCSNVGTATAFTSGPTGGSGGAISAITLGPLEGQGGIATYDTDNNMMGVFMYDNSGASGNPLAGRFAIPQGGQESPGLAVWPWGMRRGAKVSG